MSAGETIDRRVTPEGHELLLLKRETEFEIHLEGRLLVASDCRRSERSLVELAMSPLSQRDDKTVLLAGLGMGHTLRAVLDAPGVIRVDVLEMFAAVVDWNREHFGRLNGDALADPRVHLHTTDVLGFLKRIRYTPIEEVKEGWLAFLLDVDNGPSITTRRENEALYSDEGIVRLEAALRPGGVLAVWSAVRELEFLQRMHARMVNVAELLVPVDVGGQASLDYIYRGRRPAEPRSGGNGKSRIAQA